MSIQPVIAAAVELQRQLRAANFEFCIIGGIAVQRWGEVRMTVDADATVITGWERDEELVDHLLAHFQARRADGRAFALEYRVLLLSSSDGTPIDVALGALDFEVRSVERSSLWAYADGVAFPTCSAEDLLVHKAFASRERDWIDVDGILARQGHNLRMADVLNELRPLAELKEDPAIISRLEAMARRRGVWG